MAGLDAKAQNPNVLRLLIGRAPDCGCNSSAGFESTAFPKGWPRLIAQSCNPATGGRGGQ